MTYPETPKGLLPLPGKSTEADRGCDLWDEIFDAAVTVNPAFNIYRIFDTVRLSVSTSRAYSDQNADVQLPAIVAHPMGRPRVPVRLPSPHPPS